MTVAQTSISNHADVKTDTGTNSPSGEAWIELRLAAQAVLREADQRSESRHSLAYTCPWKQLTRLRKALEAL